MTDERPSVYAARDTFFDSTAEEFTRSVDGLIAEGLYKRGTIFSEAAMKFLPGGAAILDYGCGPGRISWLLATLGFQVTGIDPSAGMIRQALQQPRPGLHLEFHSLHADFAEGRAGTYEGVVCSSVIEYHAEPRELLLTLRSYLRPGGILIVSFANRLSLWRMYARLRARGAAPHTRFQRQLSTVREFRELVESCGFTVTAGVRYFDSPFEQWPVPAILTEYRFVGTLGLIVARRTQ